MRHAPQQPNPRKTRRPEAKGSRWSRYHQILHSCQMLKEDASMSSGRARGMTFSSVWPQLQTAPEVRAGRVDGLCLHQMRTTPHRVVAGISCDLHAREGTWKNSQLSQQLLYSRVAHLLVRRVVTDTRDRDPRQWASWPTASSS